ncbi:8909_t:CDS:1, partial [Funneliformis mosseae]
NDIAKWDQENFEALKETLNQFIPLIQFTEISPADFFDKVHPYKAIISSQKYEKIVEFYCKEILKKAAILPSRVGKLASTIIKPKFATIIANWIEKLDSNVYSFNNKYRFNMIYSSGLSALDCRTFHIRCNRQGPFVVLIKLPSKKIYGGYNLVGYALRDGQWLLSSDSFIFSFENDQVTHNMRMGRVFNTQRSVYEHCNKEFFNFGNNLSMKEQKIYLRNVGNYNNVWDNVSLIIEKIEVFSVVKK